MRLNAACQVRLPPQLESRLRRMADASGFRPSELIRRAIDQFLRRAETERKLVFEVIPPAVSSGPYMLPPASGCALQESLAEGAESKSQRETGSAWNSIPPGGKRVALPAIPTTYAKSGRRAFSSRSRKARVVKAADSGAETRPPVPVKTSSSE